MGNGWMVRACMASLLAFAVMAAGCGKDSSTPSGKSEGNAAAGDTGPVRMVYIPASGGNAYFEAVTAGFEKAAAETGADFTVVASASPDATGQLPILKDQIQRGVNVIAISPNSSDALKPALKEAMAKGIAVITVDSDLPGNEQLRTVCVLPADPQAVGEGQLELMGSLLNYTGKFAILSATPEAANQNRWIEVMKKTLASNPKYKQMQLLEVVYGNDEPQRSEAECTALLAKYPELQGILAPTPAGLAAAAQCVQAAGKAKQVAVTGLGSPRQMRPFVAEGTVKTFALWNPYDEGYLSGQLGTLLSGKSTTPAAGTSFNIGTAGDAKVQAKGVVIAGQMIVFTKDNIEQYSF